MKTPQVEIVDLTKKLAHELWDVNPDYQRGISPTRVRALAAEMTGDNWQLAPDAITVTINPDGSFHELINGQHRVKARIEANGVRKAIPVQLLKLPAGSTPTVSGEDNREVPAVYLVADHGKTRSWTDMAKAIGVPRPEVTAGAIRICEQVDRLGHFNPKAKPAGTDKQRYDWWQGCDQDLMSNSVSISQHTYTTLRLGRPRYAAFFYLAARDIDPDLVSEFTDKVIGHSGTSGSKDPCQALRERAVKWKMATGHTPSVIQWNTLVRAWHYFLTQEEVERLWWSPRNAPLKVVPEWWEGE